MACYNPGMEAILEPLVRSPKFLRYVEVLTDLRDREEIARRKFRDSLDEDIRAEFINGEVVVQMTSRDKHTTTVRNIARLADIFAQTRGLGAVRPEKALTGFTRNDYAPDICFWLTAKSSHFTGNTTIYPAPDYICEVLSSSTESRDRGVKFEDYAAHGVGEYWIVDPEGEFIEQYVERGGRYELLGNFTDGIIRSSVIVGIEMPVRAAFDDQLNVATLRTLLA